MKTAAKRGDLIMVAAEDLAGFQIDQMSSSASQASNRFIGVIAARRSITRDPALHIFICDGAFIDHRNHGTVSSTGGSATGLSAINAWLEPQLMMSLT